MYCRNCGKELIGTPEICMGCGAKPLAGNSFCQACGAATNPLAEMCIKCGAKLAKAAAVGRGGKSKTASVLLAVFLGPWAWLYTYRRDGWKFWVGLGISFVNVILILATLGVWGVVSWIVSLGIWIWAIVDVAVKGSEWYQSY